MTVQAVPPSSRYTASPGADTFVYEFKIRRAADLLVRVDGVTKTLGVDYTVTGVTNSSGSVLFTVPMVGGELVQLDRDMPYDRTTDFQNLGDLLSATLNNDQDDPVMMIQQLGQRQKYMASFPDTLDPDSYSRVLPAPINPLYIYRVNASGNGIELAEPPEIATVADGAITDEKVSPIAGIQSNKIAFRQSGAGAIDQLIEAKLRRNLLDVMDFGALGDSETDDSAAFAAAIAECQSRGGGTVLVPGRTFLADVTIPDGHPVMLEGVGPSSCIKGVGDTGDIINVIAWYSGVSRIKVAGSPTRTSGTSINLNGVDGFAYRCYIEGDRTGIRMFGVGCKAVENTFLYAAPNADRIYATGGDTSQLIQNNIMYATTGVHAGIFVDNSAALKIFDNDIVGQGISLLVSPGNGQHVFSLWSRGNFYDSATAGILINPSGTGEVTRVAITDDWASSHSQNGIQLIASGSALIDGVDIDGCECHLNAGNGIGLTGSQVKNVAIRHPRARSNSAGLSLDGCVNVMVENLQFGSYANLGPNTIGIYIAGGATYRITGGDVRGQSVVGFAAGSTTQVISRLWGFQQPRAVPTFQNSWVNYTGLPGYQTASYWKDEFGVVHLAGVIASGSLGNAAFTLPAGFRPTAIENFPTSNAAAFGTLEVRTDGSVVPTVGSTVSVSLNGITFLAADSP